MEIGRSHNVDTPVAVEERLTEIQALVVTLIHKLLASDCANVDWALDDCLARLGAYAGRDRAYVFLVSGPLVSNTHEWCAPGISPMQDQLQDLRVADYGALFAPLIASQILNIADIADFAPGSMEYEILAAQQIRSLLLVPMLDDSGLFGIVGFDSVTERGDFLPGETYLLRAFADVVRTVLTRRKAIADMHAAQEELAKERAFLQGIVSTDAAGFVVLDTEGVIIFANQAAETILDVPLSGLLGQRFDAPHWRLTDLADCPIAPEDHPFVRLRRGSAMVRNQRLALHLADEVRYISINAAPITNGCPATCHIVYAITDVTQLVEAEKAREAALEAAHRATQAKSSFLANMSHEIRTPLNGILGIAQILQTAITDPAQKQMAAILMDSGELLMNILNDLLDMTKIEADAIELEIIPFQLADLARRVEEVHTLRASEKQLSFAVTLQDPTGFDRLGDLHRLMQILHNLISNALKFTQSGAVRVGITASDATQVVLHVQDTGIGMTAQQAEHVLEPFAQADSTITRRFGGTGLGMAIVRRLTDMMGGALHIDSVPGVGTSVTITLPLPAQPPIAAPQTPAPAGLAPLPPLAVLAADDNRTNQMILGMMLGQLGAHVTQADDGIAALERYRESQFDLLILDISMPLLDGVALLREMRRLEAAQGRARCPAIAFTANAMTHQVQSYLDAGFDGCVTKPLKLERLHGAIAKLIAPGAAEG